MSAFTISCLVALPSFAQVANYCDLGMTFIGGNNPISPPINTPTNPFISNPSDPYFGSSSSNPYIPDGPCWIGDANCSAQDSSTDNGYGG